MMMLSGTSLVHSCTASDLFDDLWGSFTFHVCKGLQSRRESFANRIDLPCPFAWSILSSGLEPNLPLFLLLPIKSL